MDAHWDRQGSSAPPANRLWTPNEGIGSREIRCPAGAKVCDFHPMVPWHRGRYQILERRESYDPVRFRNEVLGLPTTLGEQV